MKTLSLAFALILFGSTLSAHALEVQTFEDPELSPGLYISASSSLKGACIALHYTNYVRGSLARRAVNPEDLVEHDLIVNGVLIGTEHRTRGEFGTAMYAPSETDRENCAVVKSDGSIRKFKNAKIIREITCTR